jgi:amino acid adenylation domain-containing protein
VTEECIHDRVRQWAARRPDAVALVAGEYELTYGQVDAAAEALAGQLRRHRAGPEKAVGLCVPRSPDFVVAALAVLKTGGYYVPVDPAYPQHRQNLMVRDAAVRLMVSTQESVQRWQEAGLRPVPLPSAYPATEPSESPATGPSESPATGPSASAGPVGAAHPAGLAYVVYTSGSTGTPKGVAVSHRSVLNLIDADPRLRVAPDDVVAQLAPTAFDASVFEIWCALGNGARVAFIACDEVSVASIERDLDAYRPDWLFLTTGLFHALMQRRPAALDKVGHVITGGDVLSPKHIRTAADRSSGNVYAAYGPTEATVFSSLHHIDRRVHDERVPLGTPLSGRTMTVVGEDLRPVADGEPGEICVGGAGLARGYLGQPGASAERFVPDPLSPVPGRRLYRTGDLGRRRPDGTFEFLGRADRQVKIRGFRVEPGEIEAFLETCEGVETALVTPVEIPGADKRLVAYLVPSAQTAIGVADLRAMASEHLPAYALPSYYVMVEILPLDPNGKVDRRALPSPWRSRDLLGLPPYEAPRTGVEEAIATVLVELLGLDRVGRDDDFFALGGTSLQSVQILERLRAIRYPVTSREFFANSTVASLAELIDGKLAGSPRS